LGGCTIFISFCKYHGHFFVQTSEFYKFFCFMLCLSKKYSKVIYPLEKFFFRAYNLQPVQLNEPVCQNALMGSTFLECNGITLRLFLARNLLYIPRFSIFLYRNVENYFKNSFRDFKSENDEKYLIFHLLSAQSCACNLLLYLT